jgi:hypothetical protein
VALGLVLLVLSGTRSSAQEPSSNVGVSSVGAVGVFGGVGQLERSSTGEEGGILADLGWLRGRQVRLQGELSMLR